MLIVPSLIIAAAAFVALSRRGDRSKIASFIAERGGAILSLECDTFTPGGNGARVFAITFVEPDGRIVAGRCLVGTEGPGLLGVTSDRRSAVSLADGCVVGHAEPGEASPGAAYLARQAEIDRLVHEP